MTANKRIALNVIATYGRSLYALVIGLFCGRWTLMVLGEVDYGLFGLVAGLTAFVAFFCSLFSSAIGRYYAYAVGRANADRAAGLEECQRWFSIAVAIHTALPIIMVAVGYPIGVWAIEHWLTIPTDRVVNCVWVWRYVCISCFVGMATIPFQAMYTAKQEIAELTIYGVVATTLNVVGLYFMLTHPRDWLVMFAAWTCFISATPQIIIAIRACICYEECKFSFRYAWNWTMIKELSVFAGFRFMGALAIMVSNQGMAILVNKILGPAKNAAMTVGNTLASQSVTFAGALAGALSPAIANAYGEGNLDRMRKLSLYACKFSGLLTLLFALPLAVEAKEVLTLWLKNPPVESAPLCIAMLGVVTLENLSCGHYMAIFAVGKIGLYQTFMSIASVLALAFAIIGLIVYPKLIVIGLALVLAKGLVIVVRLYYARKIAGLSAREWIFGGATPLAVVSLLCIGIGLAVQSVFAPSFGRVCISTAVIVPSFLILSWFLALTKFDKEMLIPRLKKVPIFRRIFK